MLAPPATRRHLIAVDDLGPDDVERILDAAEGFAALRDRGPRKAASLRDRTVMTVFFEASTRTSSSF